MRRPIFWHVTQSQFGLGWTWHKLEWARKPNPRKVENGHPGLRIDNDLRLMTPMPYRLEASDPVFRIARTEPEP